MRTDVDFDPCLSVSVGGRLFFVKGVEILQRQLLIERTGILTHFGVCQPPPFACLGR
jgi:hypothetical protein